MARLAAVSDPAEVERLSIIAGLAKVHLSGSREIEIEAAVEHRTRSEDRQAAEAEYRRAVMAWKMAEARLPA